MALAVCGACGVRSANGRGADNPWHRTFVLSILLQWIDCCDIDDFPRAVLGVILFLTGVQLALGSCDFSKNKGERFITLATAGFAMWNVGLAFVVGLTLSYLERRGRLRI